MEFIHETFEEIEDDNIKVYHTINGIDIDVSPYCYEEDLEYFIAFFKEFNFFPTRKDHPTDTCGSLDCKRIEDIREHLNNKQ